MNSLEIKATPNGPSNFDLTQKVNIKEFLTKSKPGNGLISCGGSPSMNSIENATIFSSKKTLVEQQEAKVGKFYFKTIENSQIYKLIKKQ
jgi:hypothetical protein